MLSGLLVPSRSGSTAGCRPQAGSRPGRAAPRCPSPSAAERPTSSPGFPRQPGDPSLSWSWRGQRCFWGGGVTGWGVVLVEIGAGICAGGCCTGRERPEPTGLCVLAITFSRKHVYTCGEARVIPSESWVFCYVAGLRGAEPHGACVLGGGEGLGPPGDVTEVPGSLCFAVCPHILPAGRQQFRKHLGRPARR